MKPRRLNQDLNHHATIEGNYIPLGYGQVTNLSTAQPLPNIPSDAIFAIIAIEGAGVEWRDDGTAPTASVGMPLPAGSVFEYNGDLAAIRFIAQTGSPILNVSYYG